MMVIADQHLLLSYVHSPFSADLFSLGCIALEIILSEVHYYSR
jgi:hypothetical protein